MHFSDIRFGLNRGIVITSVLTSAMLSLAIDRPLMQDHVLSLYLAPLGHALPLVTFVVVAPVLSVIGHVAWLLIQVVAVVLSLLLTLSIIIVHTYFFEKSVDNLILLKHHLEHSIAPGGPGLLKLAGDLLGFSVCAMVAVWFHHKAESRVRWLFTFGIFLAAAAAAYRSIP